MVNFKKECFWFLICCESVYFRDDVEIELNDFLRSVIKEVGNE